MTVMCGLVILALPYLFGPLAIEQQAADIAQLQRIIGALETQAKNARERGEDVKLLEEKLCTVLGNVQEIPCHPC